MSEKIRLAVCVASSGQCKTFFASSLAALFGAAHSAQFWPQVESMEMTLFVIESSVIHTNREKLIQMALDWDATHVLFLDDDMVFRPETVFGMFGRRHDIVICNYPKRTFPISPTAITIGGQPMGPKQGGIEEALYGGFGCALFSAEVFKQVRGPRFLPQWDEASQSYSTEDYPFFQKAREHGFKCWVDHEASSTLAHRGDYTFTWESPNG